MKEFKKYASFISLGLVVVALIMLFISPALSYEIPIVGTTAKINEPAFKIIFGIEDNFKFNILGFIAVLLLVVGLIVPFLTFDAKPRHFIAAIVLVVAGIMLFVFPSTIQVTAGGFSADVSFDAGWPVIVAGVMGILAGVVNFGRAVV